jgi:hypothetical protein
VACPLVTRLLGQLASAIIRLPVLDKNLDESTARMALDNIERLPTEVGSDQIALRLFLGVFDGHDEPLGFVGADIQPRTPHQCHPLLTALEGCE